MQKQLKQHFGVFGTHIHTLCSPGVPIILHHLDLMEQHFANEISIAGCSFFYASKNSDIFPKKSSFQICFSPIILTLMQSFVPGKGLEYSSSLKKFEMHSGCSAVIPLLRALSVKDKILFQVNSFLHSMFCCFKQINSFLGGS